MSRIATSVAATLLAAAVAVPAGAQDAATTFTGPRIEATVGLDQLHFDLDQVGRSGETKRSDLGYGVTLGYDVALAPRLVGGIAIGSDFSDVSFTRGGATNGGFLRERRDITVAGRLGTPITPSTLLYAEAGYTNLQVRRDVTTAGVQSGSLRDLDGVLAGAGVEVKVSPAAYLKSEYRYTGYQDGYSGNTVLTGFGIRF